MNINFGFPSVNTVMNRFQESIISTISDKQKRVYIFATAVILLFSLACLAKRMWSHKKSVKVLSNPDQQLSVKQSVKTPEKKSLPESFVRTPLSTIPESCSDEEFSDEGEKGSSSISAPIILQAQNTQTSVDTPMVFKKFLDRVNEGARKQPTTPISPYSCYMTEHKNRELEKLKKEIPENEAKIEKKKTEIEETQGEILEIEEGIRVLQRALQELKNDQHTSYEKEILPVESDIVIHKEWLDLRNLDLFAQKTELVSLEKNLFHQKEKQANLLK